MKVAVECYAGYCGEETPRWIRLGGKRIEIESILDRWLSPDHRYFKARGKDGAIYILRHDPRRFEWELTFYRRGTPG